MSLEIPAHLLASIDSGKVVPVLGAGASLSSKNRKGQRIVSSATLAAIVAKAAGFEYHGEGISTVFEAANPVLGNEGIKQILTDEFCDCYSSNEMNLFFGFSWKRVYTFNIDDVMRNTKKSGRVQQLKFVNALRERRTDWAGFSECQVIYLHGVASEYENGIIFSETEYAKELHKKSGWYERLGEDYSDYTILFVGTSLDEPILDYHINTFIENYGEAGRSYVLTPGEISPLRLSALKNKNITHIRGTLDEFMATLERKYPTGLPPKFIISDSVDSSATNLDRKDIDSLRSIYPINESKLLKRPSISSANPQIVGKEFYEGFGPSWATIVKRIPAQLAQYKALGDQVSRDLENGERCVCIIGEAGSGKSTFCYNAALELSKVKDYEVFDYKDDNNTLGASIHALNRYRKDQTDSVALVFVDQLHLYSDELGQLLMDPSLGSIRFLTSCRKSEWNSKIVNQFPRNFIPREFKRFEETDIPQLIDGVTKYLPVPKFTQLQPSEKIKEFKRSNKQLLIALREVTESKKFEDVISDEISKISDPNDRLLLALASWATIARSGITRGVAESVFHKIAPSGKFRNSLLNLEGIVWINEKGRLFARHEIYADLIIRNALTKGEVFNTIDALLDHFSRYEMPVIHQVSKSDGQLFKYTINNFNFHKWFRGDKPLGMQILDKYAVAFQLDGHYWLQKGLFQRRIGEQKSSLDSLEKSILAYSSNKFALHALAQQKLIVASIAPSYGAQQKKLISEAVGVLLEQHYAEFSGGRVNQYDDYAIVTLSNHHINALVMLDQIQSAKIEAKKYFEILEEARRSISSSNIEETRTNLGKFILNGVWKKHRTSTAIGNSK